MDYTLQNMDLDKRERIINAAIKEFSLYPYDRASTNNIVKNAGISKGLLFHYFGNKRELYERLIGFVLNKLFTKITTQIDWDERDIFERIKATVLIKMKVGQTYPNMFEFIVKVLLDTHTSNIEDVKILYEKYGIDIQNLLGDIYTKNIDFSVFRDPQTVSKCINIIRWTMERYAEEWLLKIDTINGVNYSEIGEELDAYVTILRGLCY